MSRILCTKCPKSFQSVSSRNRHLRDIHNDCLTSNSRIICPLCNISCCSFNMLTIHLCKNHDITCQSTDILFNTTEDFDIWKERTERDTKSFFALTSTAESTSGKTLYYECHYSNLAKFQSSSSARAPKVSGSIKINGVCPSRIRAEIHSDTGKVSVTFSKTHVGHKEELRCQPISETEKNCIIEQLKLGVSHERILQNARLVENNECQRINLLTKKDIQYIAQRNKLGGRRSQSDFVAVDMKVAEWNEGGKENVFFYKKIGESHNILEKDDFVLAYMNENMAYMLKTFGSRLICADGTHGTNPYKFELTTYLVLDDQNLGYPVVFLITNRRDTFVQEVVISKIKDLIGVIVPEFIMTDDSPVYYNAWTTVMGKIPQRLICTWHVIKNWAIHTKSKIQDQEIRRIVENDLKILLKETNREEFLRLKHCLLRYLEDKHEVSFLNYLNTYYFQNEERISSWAHSYRQHVGINTNMHLESFHKLLKYKYLGGKTVQRLETCLDALDKLIADKSWKRIASILRPTATHQDHLVNKAHKQAAMMDFKNLVETADGTYLVHSQSKIDFYEITLVNSSCNCRTLKCPICEFCVHRFSCTCYESTIKNHVCKHIHLVGLYIKNKAYPADVNQPMTVETHTEETQLNEELNLRILETIPKPVNEDARKDQCRAILESVLNTCNSDDDYNDVIKNLLTMKEHLTRANLPSPITSRKKKIEKQTFFPNKQIKH